MFHPSYGCSYKCLDLLLDLRFKMLFSDLLKHDKGINKGNTLYILLCFISEGINGNCLSLWWIALVEQNSDLCSRCVFMNIKRMGGLFTLKLDN